jgi:serine protease DegS
LIISTAQLSLNAQTEIESIESEPGYGIVDQMRRAHEAVISIRTYLSDGKESWSRVGSGFLYGRDGFAVTRRCVIDGGDSIVATLANGLQAKAWVVYSDDRSEVALLKLPFSESSPVTYGKGSNLAENSHVVVLGNSMGVFPSVSMGTYMGRRNDGMMMLGFVVPPGNCGSPVLDGNGRVVGLLMGRMVDEQDEEALSQTGIALPIENVKRLIDDMLAMIRQRRGWVGMSVTDLQGLLKGQAVEVVKLVSGGPVEQADISVGDTLVAINGKPIMSAKALAAEVQKIVPGDEIEFTIRKRGADFRQTVRVGSLPWKN